VVVLTDFLVLNVLYYFREPLNQVVVTSLLTEETNVPSFKFIGVFVKQRENLVQIIANEHLV